MYSYIIKTIIPIYLRIYYEVKACKTPNTIPRIDSQAVISSFCTVSGYGNFILGGMRLRRSVTKIK